MAGQGSLLPGTGRGPRIQFGIPCIGRRDWSISSCCTTQHRRNWMHEMGRINRWSEAALKSAVEMLATTNDQKFKANLIRTILDYEVRQQERAESNKSARRKRAENTEPA